MAERVNFFSEDIRFQCKQKGLIRKWINETIASRGLVSGDINIIFCSDNYLLKLNKRFLNRETLTDVIAFQGDDSKNRIGGDIFISVERVKENADKYGTGFLKELTRVIIHGTLHLTGLEDKTISGKREMTIAEDYYLSRIGNMIMEG